MENDLISRANLLKTINKKPKSEGNLRAAQLLDAILNVPSVEAEPVRHGRWKYPLGMAWNYVCSECGYGNAHTITKLPYCPSCGAKMDGGAESDR